jgi:hypothetical protein
MKVKKFFYFRPFRVIQYLKKPYVPAAIQIRVDGPYRVIDQKLEKLKVCATVS